MIIAIAAALGLIGMSVWGTLDKEVDKSPGATVTGALLIGALGCGLSGHMIPEGAVLLLFAIFAWLMTLGDIGFSGGARA